MQRAGASGGGGGVTLAVVEDVRVYAVGDLRRGRIKITCRHGGHGISNGR